MSPLHDPEARIRRSTAPYMPGNALLGQHSANRCLVRGDSGLLQQEKVQVNLLDACNVLRNTSFRQVRLASDEVDTGASISPAGQTLTYSRSSPAQYAGSA